MWDEVSIGVASPRVNTMVEVSSWPSSISQSSTARYTRHAIALERVIKLGADTVLTSLGTFLESKSVVVVRDTVIVTLKKNHRYWVLLLGAISRNLPIICLSAPQKSLQHISKSLTLEECPETSVPRIPNHVVLSNAVWYCKEDQSAIGSGQKSGQSTKEWGSCLGAMLCVWYITHAEGTWVRYKKLF